jgi:hypothetical protein
MGQLRWPFVAAEGCSQIPPGAQPAHFVTAWYSVNLNTRRCRTRPHKFERKRKRGGAAQRIQL